ncbi:MAG TPA: hypothetical protein DCR24_04700 [Bacillus bacterium]|nr:hypothetical protein [Bacillus sp. (in: firmicutes)]
MTNQNDDQVAHGIKETAGAAFHAAHNALETTENAAMSAVDATNKAVKNAAKNVRNMATEGSDNRNQ